MPQSVYCEVLWCEKLFSALVVIYICVYSISTCVFPTHVYIHVRSINDRERFVKMRKSKAREGKGRERKWESRITHQIITRTFLVSFNWAHSSYPQQPVLACVCARALVCVCSFYLLSSHSKITSLLYPEGKPKWSEFIQCMALQCRVHWIHTHTFIESSFFL